MTSVIAVDGGQSAVRVRHSGSSRVAQDDGVSRLEGDTIAAVAASVAAGWAQLGEPETDRAILGLSTAPTDPADLDRLASLVSSAVGATEVWICDDSVTAHFGALSGDWGVSLTAGTGVACLGLRSGTGTIVVDGHGYLLGDDGGGFWIGREGLRAVLRHGDGRGAVTALTERAVERFGPVGQLPVRVHGMPRAVNEIAQFAVDVLESSAIDEVAAEILHRAASSLAETVHAAVTAVREESSTVPVALGGRLLSGQSPLFSALESAIRQSVPHAVVRPADASPLEGALLLGLGGVDSRREALIHQWRRESP